MPDQKPHPLVKIAATIGALGGLGGFLSWLGVKPGDLMMIPTLPHITALIIGSGLFATSIGLSVRTLFFQRKELAKLKDGYEDQIKLLEASHSSEHLELRAPSKLVIYSANYAAVDGGGKRYEVDDFMRRIISGDSLVLDVENHNFALADKNYVPLDPKPSSTKRLEVTYSYDGGTPQTIERPEHFRMVLPEDTYVNDSLTKVIEQFGKKDLLDELKDIDYAAKSEALAERKQVDGLLVPLQIEALAIAKELRDFHDSLDPYPHDPVQRPDEPNGDLFARRWTIENETRPQWERKLSHGYANRDFGRKVASVFHRAGEEYDLEYPPDMLSRSAEIGPSLTSYGIPKLAQEMEMIAIWINRKQRNEVSLLS